jgi:metal-dependent amidase/aminoacylase/carboxypeptidase family protein
VFEVEAGSVGCIAKKITYKGVASHAGGAPWAGKNALYAANCGLNAINAIRETFRESDVIRVHPIITSGGAMVNAIPDKVTMERYVRGATFQGIVEANRKVNQALCGAALSIGANVDITDIPGYAPLYNDPELIQVTKEAVELAIPQHQFLIHNEIRPSSTDMGDLSCIMPVVHPYAGGTVGTSHGSDYYIQDPVAACVDSAKMQLAMLYILLSDQGKRAYKIIKEYKPLFASKEEYLAFMDNLNTTGDRIDYSDPAAAKVRLD